MKTTHVYRGYLFTIEYQPQDPAYTTDFPDLPDIITSGGIKPGMTLGKTDELGFHTIEDPVHVHDLQATILHLLGLDHKRLTYKFQGRDFRLTDISGNVVSQILA